MLDFLGHLYSPSTYLGTCQAQSETRSRNSRIKALPRARFLDLDEVADLGHPLKLQHMMPSAGVFARACSKNVFRSLLTRFCDLVDALSRGTRYHPRVSCCPVSCCNGWTVFKTLLGSAVLCYYRYDSVGVFSSPRALLRFKDPCVPRSHVVKRTNFAY